MTRAERSSVNKQVGKMLDEVGEVGPLGTVSDERLLKLVKAGVMQLAAASGPAVSKFIMPRLTAYVVESNVRGLQRAE
jgi:hypothetical protein